MPSEEARKAAEALQSTREMVDKEQDEVDKILEGLFPMIKLQSEVNDGWEQMTHEQRRGIAIRAGIRGGLLVSKILVEYASAPAETLEIFRKLLAIIPRVLLAGKHEHAQDDLLRAALDEIAKKTGAPLS